MKHHKSVRKFGREKNQRNAFIKGLVSALILNGRIETTLARAKEIRPHVERIVTYGKANTLSSRRQALAKLYNHQAEVNKIFNEYAPKYKDTNGGYTRIIKLNPRLSDAAEMAIIEFV
ncbi:MAG: large subunit ribosomal protein [Patescibacteria group bacterium]|nr:large subunit ribosomal protein [Patescibacteria group bacterium]